MQIDISKIKYRVLEDLDNIHGPNDIADHLGVPSRALREHFRQEDPDRLWMFITKMKKERFFEQLSPYPVAINKQFVHAENIIDLYRSFLLNPDDTWVKCVQEIIHLIQKNPFNKDLCVDWIKGELNILDKSCTQKFYHFMHMSVLEYIRWHRLGVAIYLLGNSSLNVGDIGLLIGYDSGSAFSKAFARDMGCSPSGYRKKSTPSRQIQQTAP